MTLGGEARAHSLGAVLRRWWWAVLLAGLVGAGGSYALLTQTSTSYVSGVINTRPAADLPTDRIDLIADLSTALQQDSVLAEVAEKHDMSVDALRNAIGFSRIGSSNLVSVTLAWGGDDEEGFTVLRELVDSATQYVVGPESEVLASRLREARGRVQAARKEVARAIMRNGGVQPQEQLRRLQRRLDAPTDDPDEKRELAEALRSVVRFEALQQDVRLAEDFAAYLSKLVDDRTYARTRLESAIAVTPSASKTEEASQGAVMRRSLAAGVAAALLTAVVVGAVELRRRRRTAGDRP